MKRKRLILFVVPLILAFAAVSFVLPGTAKYVYVQRTLASDPAGIARNRVELLLAPWGLAQGRAGEWWIAVHGKGVLLALTDKGAPVRGSIITVPSLSSTPALPGKPTAVVYNGTSDFALGAGRPARVIAATGDGLLVAWNREAGNDTAMVVVDNSAYAAYTGLAIGRKNGRNYLFAANFRTASIDVFDGFFQRQGQEESLFTDLSVPDGYAPYNLFCSEGKLYVLYALQDSARIQAAPGVGDRFISVYDMDGRLLNQLAPGQGYQSAWGMVLAPPEFGRYGGMLLVANSENGTIAAVDPEDGSFRGFLATPEGWLVTIPGLRGMAFDGSRLYFAAGTEEGRYGLFGYVAPEP